MRRRLKNLLFSLPFPVSKFLRYDALKLFDFLYDTRSKDLPPMSLVRYGGYGTDIKVARLFVSMLAEHCGLHEGDAFLDLGCGVGLISLPVMSVIGSTGRLCGLDIIPESVAWCNRSIRTRWPNSEFTHADVFNASYNPMGKIRASDYRLPYENAEFDVALLKSVFTHMRSAEVHNYLAEIARVLKPGGRALITFFVLNPETRRLIAEARSQFDFSHEFEGGMVVNPDIPEDAIAFEYSVISDWFRQCGFVVKEILWGSWRGGALDVGQTATSQDVITLVKG